MPILCEVDGCVKKRGQGRKCYMHYHRLRYTGTTDSPKKSWQQTFWSHVNKTADCWLWSSCVDKAGYGLLGVTSAPSRAAHRLSWIIAYGEIPVGGHVLHRCDNPPCVRPDHLFLGDDAVNHADMANKKRSLWGERSHHAKLTESDVQEIRALIAQKVLHREIAERFSISRVTISDIRRGKSWRHLD